MMDCIMTKDDLVSKDTALKMAIILFCISLTGCIFYTAQSKCIDGKYYIKECEQCQFILEKNVECLNE